MYNLKKDGINLYLSIATIISREFKPFIKNWRIKKWEDSLRQLILLLLIVGNQF